MRNRPHTLSDGQRAEANTESRIDFQRLLEWTDGFNPSDSGEILSTLKELRIVQLKSLSTVESNQAAVLIERGCMNATTNCSLLGQPDVAEVLFAGLNALVQQGLVLTEPTTESTLGNLLTVCSVDSFVMDELFAPFCCFLCACCRCAPLEARIFAGTGASSPEQRPAAADNRDRRAHRIRDALPVLHEPPQLRGGGIGAAAPAAAGQRERHHTRGDRPRAEKDRAAPTRARTPSRPRTHTPRTRTTARAHARAA